MIVLISVIALLRRLLVPTVFRMVHSYISIHSGESLVIIFKLVYSEISLEIDICHSYTSPWAHGLGCCQLETSLSSYICIIIAKCILIYGITNTPSFVFVDGLLVMLVSTMVTSLTISWTLSGGVTATTYTISYSNTNCPPDTNDDITGIPGSETTYTLTGLQEGTEYSITVTATLSGGGTGANSLTATTIATG